MEAEVSGQSHKALFFNTLAFTICFAAWMLNGVLVTFLSDNQVFERGPVEIGWLLGIPVLTGAIFRLPAGIRETMKTRLDTRRTTVRGRRRIEGACPGGGRGRGRGRECNAVDKHVFIVAADTW